MIIKKHLISLKKSAYLTMALAVAGIIMVAGSPSNAQSNSSNLPIVQVSQHYSENQIFDAYARSPYGYCDAKKIASVWNVDEYQGKLVLGRKILSGLTHLADQDIASTRNRVYCSWPETELSYADAVALGNFWGRPAHEAKQKVQQMTSETGVKRFRQDMANVGFRL